MQEEMLTNCYKFHDLSLAGVCRGKLRKPAFRGVNKCKIHKLFIEIGGEKDYNTF